MKNNTKFLILGVLLLVSLEHTTQAQNRNQAFTFISENDVYTLRNSDKYYSNGLFFTYQWVTKAGKGLSPKNLSDSSKVIVGATLSQKYFTPKFIELSNVNLFDRPYAGLLTVGYQVDVFPKKFKGFSYALELGLTGPASGAEALQTWYHNLVGFKEPKGWGYQIPNELIVNLNTRFQRQFQLVKNKLDLISTSQLMLGTAFTNARQFVDVRFGKLGDLSNSKFNGSLLGEGGLERVYVFAGLGVEYVFHNITIQGSVWNDDAPHTENIVPWVRHMRFGAAFGQGPTTGKVVFNWLGPEVKNLKWHSYMGLEFTFRFLDKKGRKN